ncbi:MAG: amino acid permease [Propionibacteriaceae bacterium]|jgi:AAT family amino acid transporter|nr:amino acid permease [Propionibacteriaceae bacterium]
MTDSPKAAVPPAAAQETSEGLHRDLKNRHIQMIALGGAIGTGLFYGSAESIGMAGPAVVFTYLLGGAAIFFVMRALGEMAVDHPTSGAFSYFAYKNWSQRAGFVSGWNYWFNYILVSMVELVVVGAYVQYWLPDMPSWLTALIFLVVITAVNLIGVGAFGEFEFWFAIIKVVAVLAMIVVGIVIIIAGYNGQPASGLSNLWSHGGFFPNGLGGAVAALVVVMFSFGGVELVGITAGEADNPKKTIPRAINQIVYRILIFYVGALLIITAVYQWDKIDGQMSPFVEMFDGVGFTAAAHVLNVVVITAAMSVYNSGLYSNGRMLRSLAAQGNAPSYLKKVNKRGVPVAGVLTSSAITLVAVAVSFFLSGQAFGYLMSIATAAGVINWTMIMITQWRFRKRIGETAAAKLEFKMPGFPWINVVVVLFLALVVVMMAANANYLPAVIIGPLWIAILLVAYQVKRTRQKRAGQPTDV